MSENAEFSELVENSGLIWIGPSAKSITAMGSKQNAKLLLKGHPTIPLIPGYDGDDQDVENLRKQGLEVGFPLLLKASAGGGGKGMKIVRQANELASEIKSAKSEVGLLSKPPIYRVLP